MIVANCEGLQLFQAHRSIAIKLDKCGRHIRELEPLSNEQGSNAKAGGNIIDAEACADEPVKRLELSYTVLMHSA